MELTVESRLVQHSLFIVETSSLNVGRFSGLQPCRQLTNVQTTANRCRGVIMNKLT